MEEKRNKDKKRKKQRKKERRGIVDKNKGNYVNLSFGMP